MLNAEKTGRENMELKFKNGKFKIMQIADVQDTNKTSPDTIRLIEKALDTEKPDLVVFSGDQIKGYGFNFQHGDIEKKVKTAIDNIVSPVVKRNIPFTICFGNHDGKRSFSKEQQLEVYRLYSGCLAFSDGEGIDGVANHCLTVKDENGEKKLALYMLDTNLRLDIGGYDCLKASQLEWYKTKRDEIEKENGKVIPAIVFQHIPPIEVFKLLTRVNRTKRGSVRAFRKYKNQWYILNSDRVNKNGFMRESPAVPDEDMHEIDVFNEKKDVLGVYFGHDHNNSFNGKVDGIDLGYTQGCGFNVYGPGLDRGVRVFDFDENDVKNYKTYDVRYKQLLGRRLKHPLKALFYTKAPVNVYDAVDMAVKWLLIIAAVIITVLIIKHFM